jgi:hypothetical protein
MLTKTKNSLDTLTEEIEIDLNKRFVVLAKPLNMDFLLNQINPIVLDGEYIHQILEIDSLQGVSTGRKLYLMVEYTEKGFEFQSDIV